MLFVVPRDTERDWLRLGNVRTVVGLPLDTGRNGPSSLCFLAGRSYYS